MSVATPTISGIAQALIDARLEAIERILIDRVPRQDRLTIVREVESQIHDLLLETGLEEAGRDEVLAVLARLDPPEAYLTEDDLERTGPVRTRNAGVERHDRESVQRQSSLTTGFLRTHPMSTAAGLMGVASLGLIVTMSVLFALASSEVLSIGNNTLGGLLEITIFASVPLSVIMALASASIALYTRFRSWLSIVGMLSSILTWFVAAGFVIFLFII